MSNSMNQYPEGFVHGLLTGGGSILVAALVLWLFSDNDLTYHIKKGHCTIVSTEMFQPPPYRANTGVDVFPKPYMRNKVVCPETTHWRNIQ